MDNVAVKKERGALLSFWLVLMLLSNILVTIVYFFDSNFISLMSDIPVWAVYILGVGAFLNVIFTIGLFAWKKWAFFAFCGMAGIAFVVNIINGVGVVAILGLISPAILYLILRPKWSLLE